MKNARILSFIVALGAVLGMTSASNAVTIDCDDVGCIGGSYTLELAEMAAPDSWMATYTIDTSGVFSVAATELLEIEFKVANAYTSPTLESGPAGMLAAGPLAGQGCKGGNNTTFICLELNDAQSVGGVYTWKFTFGAVDILSEDDWHLGARYASSDHRQGWLISESPAGAVPEPTAALLFGAGVFVVGMATRRPRA
jgi:hypothetical protein